MVRQGLRGLLTAQPGWEIVGEASTGRQAVHLARELHPDVVIMDITLPELNGFEASRQIRKSSPESEVLVVTMHDSESVVREALDAGARGYIVKTDAVRHLAGAVDALSKHTPFFASAIAQMLLEEYLRGDQRHGGVRAIGKRLTPREREIVQLLVDGKSNKEVAAALGISTRTAEKHRANIMQRLGLHSMSELVRFAIRNRLVQP